MDIGEWIPEDAVKGALEAGAWMAEHPEALFEMTERDRKCRAAYLRELKTGRPPKEPPEGYAKFVKYVGPTVRRDWLAERASRRERRESAGHLREGDAGHRCPWRNRRRCRSGAQPAWPLTIPMISVK